MHKYFYKIFVWILVAVLLFILFKQFDNKQKNYEFITYTQFIEQAKLGNISNVEIQGDILHIMSESGKYYSIISPGDIWMISDLLKYGVQVSGKAKEEQSLIMNIFISWFPMFLLIGVWIFFMKQMQNGGKSAFNFGKSKAKMLDENNNNITFSDVAGCEEAKEDVKELIDFLRNPNKFQKLGGRIPRGILMIGSPGTGKTLLAKAIAGESRVPFFSISGSDFVEMFVGVGAARVRDMFENAKIHSPCIIFIDEIDAVGRQRGAGLGGGNDEREQTLNQMLVEMDGFESGQGVLVIAATNRPDVLDPALLRPGRFDRQVVVPLPDIRGREQILKVHMIKIPANNSINSNILARGCHGFSGADLANLVNEAALFAARRDGITVNMLDFEKAKDKIIMGSERRSIIMPEKERKNTSYHESGHVIVAKMLNKIDPIHKVTIIPRGNSLGMTVQLPYIDRYNNDKKRLLNTISILLGGRIAEEIFMNQITTGSYNDFERATNIAYDISLKYGMTKSLGTRLYHDVKDNINQSKNNIDKSEKTLNRIDTEITKIINNQYDVSLKIIEENLELIEAMSISLLENETLNNNQINKIIKFSYPIFSS